MNDEVEHFSAIIIGAGQAGPALAGRLTAAGRTVAIVERHHFGGTCVNTGCTPTKAMVASARVAHMARRASEFGVAVKGRVKVDLAAVKSRKDKILLKSRNGVRGWLLGMERCTVIEAHARFVGPKRIQAGDRVLEADNVFINVGGRAVVPAWDGLSDVNWLDNGSIMELDRLPEHLVVVGGSYIGLEFAQMFRRFGGKVSIAERSDRLVSREDQDVSDEIHRILVAEGIDIHLNANCIGCSGSKKPARARIFAEGGAEIRGSHLLLAMGRRPNTDDLGVDEAGVDLDQRGYIKVDDRLETSVKGVFALGDVNGRGAFTHTAYDDFEVVAANLIDGRNRDVSERILTYGLFIDPPLGRVGMTETEARDSGRPLMIAKQEMQRVGRARERSETDGFMKAIVDAETGRILGATILGIEGDEAIHTVTSTMYANAPWTTLCEAVHIHPTVSELIPTLLSKLEPVE